jgi:PleD family two-component response regulator
MPQGTLSISIGIADLLPGAQSELLNDGVSDEGTAEGLFRAADKALYLAKSKGRNLTFSV